MNYERKLIDWTLLNLTLEKINNFCSSHNSIKKMSSHNSIRNERQIWDRKNVFVIHVSDKDSYLESIKNCSESIRKKSKQFNKCEQKNMEQAIKKILSKWPVSIWKGVYYCHSFKNVN